MEAKGKLSFWDTGADGLGRLRALQACAQKWRHELESAPDAAAFAAQLRCRWNFWREARGDSARPPLAAALGLGGKSRVLLIGGEGATDAQIYRRIIDGGRV